MRHLLVSLMLMASAAAQAATARPAPPLAPPSTSAVTPHSLTDRQRQLHADAVEAFRTRRYAAAFGRFATLADAGHLPSAEAALFMLHHGLSLFGSDWDASATQKARWKATLINGARGGHDVAFDSGRE